VITVDLPTVSAGIYGDNRDNYHSDGYVGDNNVLAAAAAMFTIILISYRAAASDRVQITDMVPEVVGTAAIWRDLRRRAETRHDDGCIIIIIIIII